MRRLKEGFYGIMKLSNAVKEKPEAKTQIIEFSQNNKIEKPQTEAIIVLQTQLEDDVSLATQEEVKSSNQNLQQQNQQAILKLDEISIQFDMNDKNEETNLNKQPEEEKKAPSYQPGKQRAKQKGKKAPAPTFKKMLQLKVTNEKGVEENDIELPPSLTQNSLQSNQIPPEDKKESQLQQNKPDFSKEELKISSQQDQKIQAPIQIKDQIGETQKQEMIISQISNPVVKEIDTFIYKPQPQKQYTALEMLANLVESDYPKDPQFALKFKRQEKLTNIFTAYKQKCTVFIRYHFMLWKYLTNIIKIKNQQDQNEFVKNDKLSLKKDFIQQLKQLKDLKYTFPKQYTGLMQMIIVLQKVIIKQQRKSFAKIQMNNNLAIDEHFDQIQGNLSNLDEYIKVVKQNRVEVANNPQYLDNEAYIKHLITVSKEAKLRESEKVIKKISYTEEEMPKKLKAVVKLIQIINKLSYVDKGVLRRLRIWHSRGLREEMKILCASLSKCKKQETRINLINLQQFLRVKIQYYFYQWINKVASSAQNNQNQQHYDEFIQRSASSNQLRIRSANNKDVVSGSLGPNLKSVTSMGMNSNTLNTHASNNKRATPQSYSIDETANKGKIAQSSQMNKRHQQKLIMGSFDFDSKYSVIQPPGNQKPKPNQIRMTSQGSMNTSNISANISSNHSQNRHINFTPIDIGEVLIARSGQTKLSNHIKTITNISNQQAKYKTVLKLSPEVQSLFNCLNNQQRLIQYDSVFKIFKYKNYVQKRANNLNNQTQYIQRLSNIQVGLFILKFFQLWISVLRVDKNINKKFDQKKELKVKVLSRLQRQMSKAYLGNINYSFQKWRNLAASKSQGQDVKVESIDQGIIQVQAQVGQELERTLQKQQKLAKTLKREKLLINLVLKYESSYNPQHQKKHVLDLWAKNVGIMMEFGRITKYLQEIDISTNEKRDLDMRIAQINDDNEQIQLKMRNFTMTIDCEMCKQLIINKAQMVAQQQNERRQNVWDMYSQNESEVKRIEDDEGSQWNESSYDHIRRITSNGGSSRNLTARSGKLQFSNRNADSKTIQEDIIIRQNEEYKAQVQNNNQANQLNYQQDDNGSEQSSEFIRLPSDNGESAPNTGKQNASMNFFENQQNLNQRKGTFGKIMIDANQPRRSTQVVRVQKFGDKDYVQGDQEEYQDKSSEGSNETKMMKLDQSQFSQITSLYQKQNSTKLIIKSDDSKSLFSRSSLKLVNNPRSSQFLKDSAINEEGLSNNISQNQPKLNAQSSQVTIGGVQSSNHNDTTEMRRLSSFNTMSEGNMLSGMGQSMLQDQMRFYNKRISRISEAGTIIEEADPEQFGNDLNQELRVKEDNLRIHYNMQVQEHQMQKEMMMRKIRELQKHRDMLKAQTLGSQINHTQKIY
ncbi:UNKNOWN [Stylonychia lemnae]|uniref:Uncharacterized protein n=1 Tax=Stylonychia lemnae TaxID=5949 RepID=A0A077ZYS6_STYLE|nr:UNKNOWN [Stylonychia lemnae]|eukprot:CDW73688.1 UNKNOWN [Stylonychia lemnae]